MAQYINKAAVVAEIERIMAEEMSLFEECCKDGLDNTCSVVVYTRMKMFLSFLDTLEVKEDVVSTDTPSPNSLKISRHWNSHIEAMKEALRMEYEKGRADVLRCIDPDVMVADFCSQPLSKTRSLASIYRQGIIDIIKRINNNEETDINNTRSIDDGGVR